MKSLYLFHPISHRCASKAKPGWISLAPLVLCATASLANPVRTPPQSHPPLTHARRILRLSPDQARQNYPAKLRGVITYADLEWNLLFLQDSTGGIYVFDDRSVWKRKAGDLIEATGYAERGGYAPVFVLQKWSVRGVAPLPPPRPVALSDLLSGREDSQWIETGGILRSARRSGDRLVLGFFNSGFQFEAVVNGAKPNFRADSFIDSEARIRGVCAVKLNRKSKITGFTIYSPGLTNLRITKFEPKNPYSPPLRSIAEILRLDARRSGHRVRTEGVVTYSDSTGRIAIQDRTGAIFLRCDRKASPKLNDRAEVTGFLEKTDDGMTLTGADYRLKGKDKAPTPETIDADAALSAKSDARVIRTDASLLDLTRYAGANLLLLHSGDRILKARLERSAGDRSLKGLIPGSSLELTGIRSVQTNGDQKSPLLLLREPGDIVVQGLPRWWNQRRSWTLLSVTSLILLSALGWGYFLTNRLRMQNDLLRSLKREGELEERYRHLFENAKEMVWTQNMEGRFTSLNQAGETILGCSQEEALGLSLDQFIQEKRRVAFFEWIRNIDDRFTPITYEFSIVSKDERHITLEANMRIIFQEERPIGFEGIARDITERKRTERALEVSNQQLQDALEELQRTQSQVIRQERLRALGQMASGIAHDFNNALMPILGFSELLLNRPEYLADREKANRYLNLIFSGAQGAAKTVSRLREFYRNRDEEDERSPVDLSGLIGQAIDLTEPKWKDEARAKGRSIEILTNLSPIRTVMGDAGDLRESLINLIFNAVDAMQEGGSLTIETRQEGEDAIIEVRDTGIGMSEETREKCLEPFYTTKEKRGTGLGLAMVHGIVSRHGGAIEIESAEGRGSTIRMRLPSSEARTQTEPAEAGAPKKREALRILLAEDDPSIREYLIERLRMEGHLIDEARDGQEGWERFQSGSFDLVITDYSMPRMSGEGLSRLIKERNPRMPILMLTGFGELIKGRDQEPEGVDLILSKPLRFEELRSGIGALTQA